jgi:hypothetical protein
MTSKDFPDDESLGQAIRYLRGVRMCRTFGTWRGVPLVATPADGEWIALGPLDGYLQDALRGDKDAIMVLQELRDSRIRKFFEQYPPRPPPNTIPSMSPERKQPLLFPGMYERW